LNPCLANSASRPKGIERASATGKFFQFPQGKKSHCPQGALPKKKRAFFFKGAKGLKETFYAKIIERER